MKTGHITALLVTTALASSGAAVAQQAVPSRGQSSSASGPAASDRSSGGSPAGDPSDASATAPANADIVVTALKQGTTALRTPASVTIVPAQELIERNITTLNQLNNVVPGLVMTVATAERPGISFRGLGSNSSIFNLEPSIGQYQDGVYLGHGRDYVSPVFDLDHVEFIKGTQSTVLGKNNSLGAISIVNRRPGDQFAYNFTVSHGEGIQSNKVEGGITIPLADSLRIRLAGLASQDDGFVRNVYLDRNEARDREVSGRLMLVYEPSAEFNALFSYQHDSRRLRGQNLQVVSDPRGTVAGWSAAYGTPYVAGQPDVSAAAQRALLGGAAGADPFDNQDTDRFNLILTAELGPVTLTSQTAHVSWNSPRAVDFDFTPANLFGYVEREQSKTTTQELRLSTDAVARLHLLAGLFYYDNGWGYDRTIVGSTNIVRFPLTGTSASSTHVNTTSIAVFGSGTIDITRQLKLDAGVRYTHEKKTGDFTRSGSGVLGAAFAALPLSSFTPEVTNPVDYSVGARFQATSRLLGYVTYAVATKSGAYQDAPTTLAGAPFAPETARSVEVGVKAGLDHGSVTAAFFDTRIKDFQTSYTGAVGTPPLSQPLVGNSQVRSTGFEASAGYNVTPKLHVGAQVVYANARFTQDFSTLARAGDRLTRAPEWTEQIAAEYHTPVGNGLSLFGGGSVDFVSRTLYQFTLSQPTAPQGAPHQIINARLGVRGRADAWQLAVVGTNLANQRYVAFASSISSGGGAYFGRYDQPRVVAVQLTLKH